MRFQIPQVNRTGQHIDLRATIVDVVLAGHVIAREIQQACQCIAKHRAARVPHVQRPRRVGRDILHVRFLPSAHGRPAIVRIRQHAFHQTGPNGGRQTQIQEPGTGHFGHHNARILGQLACQNLGNVTWFHLGRLGQNHRRVRCHISMRRIARGFDRHVVKAQPLGQSAFADHLGQGINHKRTNIGKQVHRFGPFLSGALLAPPHQRSSDAGVEPAPIAFSWHKYPRVNWPTAKRGKAPTCQAPSVHVPVARNGPSSRRCNLTPSVPRRSHLLRLRSRGTTRLAAPSDGP